MKRVGKMEKKIRTKMGFLVKLKNYFTTGLLVLAPTAVSIWILLQVFKWFDNILGKWYTQLFDYLELGDMYFPGLGALTLFIIITLFGILARQYAGRKLLGVWEKIIDHVPLVNRVYVAVRQLSDSFASGGGVIFQHPIMIEYPRKGLYSIGFVTRRCEGPFCTIVGKNVSSVFIPTTPNPTSGVLIFVPQEDITLLNMSVEDAMKLIISAGTVTPDIKLPVIKE